MEPNKLEELEISELEIWLADGPDIDEIIERFADLEEKLDDTLDKVAQLEAALLRAENAHDERKQENMEFIAENEALGELLSGLVDIELERDTTKAALDVAMRENQRLTKLLEESE